MYRQLSIRLYGMLQIQLDSRLAKGFIFTSSEILLVLCKQSEC